MSTVLSFINASPLNWYLLGAVLLACLLLVWNIRLEIKLRRLCTGNDARSLEGTILHVKNGHEKLEQFRSEVERYLESVEHRLRRSVQGIGTVRFNPFKGMGVGGNQSFSTAFLNEEGDGVVISTLYARDRMSFFSKPVARFSSEHELTEEEQAAIAQAKESVKRVLR